MIWITRIESTQSRVKCFFKILLIFFLERGEGREKERERNISVWLPLAGLQSKHVP